MTNGSENKKTNSEIEAKGINSSPLPSAHLGSVRIINLGYSKDDHNDFQSRPYFH